MAVAGARPAVFQHRDRAVVFKHGKGLLGFLIQSPMGCAQHDLKKTDCQGEDLP